MLKNIYGMIDYFVTHLCMILVKQNGEIVTTNIAHNFLIILTIKYFILISYIFMTMYYLLTCSVVSSKLYSFCLKSTTHNTIIYPVLLYIIITASVYLLKTFWNILN